MPETKKISNKPVIFKECKKYNIPIWQCPSFIFLLIGVVIVVAILVSYFIANSAIKDQKTVSLIVLAIAFILLIVNFIITKSFEKIAEANRLKSEFVGIVSNQLRTPLSNLRYAIQFLISDKVKDFSQKELEHFKSLEENSRGMGSLIDNFLIVSRLETNELELKKEEFSLPDLVKRVILKSKEFSESSNVKTRMRTDKNIPPVFADRNWTGWVIQTLFDNAVRYIKNNGEIEVRIKASSNKVFFKIHDSGVGIPKEEQKFIFQKFFRTENALKEKTQGSGLGLFITKELVQLMAGKIWFDSNGESGTNFYFTLPLAKRENKKV